MQTIEETLKERGDRYGDFTDHAAICDNIVNTMTSQPGWSRCSAVHR